MGGSLAGATGKPPVMAASAAALALLDRLPAVRGTLTPDADIAALIWFRCGGTADILFEPADADDLQQFLQHTPVSVPVYPLGLGSNLIVRDGGVAGVVVRFGKAFSFVRRADGVLTCGGGTPGILAASSARDISLAGLEFLRGIPGTVGGAVKMNAGAYGRDMSDVLLDAELLLRDGTRRTYTCADFGFSYRHSALPEGACVVSARLRGMPGDKAAITAEMERIAQEREASQPLRSRTGGSTFKNPPGAKAWALVDAAGCRGLIVGGAQVSEKHTNFLINMGDARAADIEQLGDEVRRRVLAQSGVDLHWEIERIGRPA
jgi:UDP-N-acetylmuramate dehydrogenase